MSKKSIAIIGYASGIGGNILGCSKGPKAIRERNLVEKIKRLGLKVSDFGDVGNNTYEKQQIDKAEQNINHIQEVYGACKELSEKTTEALDAKMFPVILGGDHSLPIGSTAAISDFYQKRDKQIGLIWVDTHADINTPRTSPSNNPFGMTVAVLLGKIPGLLSSIQNFKPAILPENIVYIGLRDVDKGEKELLKDLGITCYTMREVDLEGIGSITEKAITKVTNNTAGFVCSFDLDVCDPKIVPGTGTPERGGLTYRESHLLLELIAESKKMLGFEIVELNPTLDVEHQTADLAVSLIESALGKTIL